MKAYKTISLVLLAVLFAFCSRVSADVIFQDDFQTDTVGTDPVIGTGDIGGSWSYVDTDGTMVSVLNNLTPSTNNYTKVSRSGYGASEGQARMGGLAAELTQNKDVTLSFSLYRPSTAASSIYIGQTGAGFDLRMNTDGTVSYQSGGNVYSTSVTYAMDAWQNVVLDFDMSARTYDITVGSSTASASWADDVHAFDTMIAFAHLGGPAGEYYIDNVTLDAVPEPSVFILLSVGLLSLLAYAWRKRK